MKALIRLHGFACAFCGHICEKKNSWVGSHFYLVWILRQNKTDMRFSFKLKLPKLDPFHPNIDVSRLHISCITYTSTSYCLKSTYTPYRINSHFLLCSRRQRKTLLKTELEWFTWIKARWASRSWTFLSTFLTRRKEPLKWRLRPRSFAFRRFQSLGIFFRFRISIAWFRNQMVSLIEPITKAATKIFEAWKLVVKLKQ